MRNRAWDLRIPRSDAPTTEPQRLLGERGLLQSSYDSDDPGSMQDACPMNYAIDLAYRRVSVAQW